MASRSVSRSGTSVASSVAGSVPGSSIAGSSYGSWRKGRGSSCGALSGSWRRRHQHEGILFDQDPSRVADFGHAIERDEERGGQPPAAPSIGGSSRRSSLSSSNPNRRAGGRAGVDKADVDAGASAPKAFRNGPGLSLASVSAGGLRPSSMGGLKPIAEGDVSEGESQLSSTRGSWTSESTWSQSGTRRRRKRVNFSQRDSLVN